MYKLIFIFIALITIYVPSYQASALTFDQTSLEEIAVYMPNESSNYPNMTEDNIPVKGSEVTIYNQDGEIVDVIVTDEDGFAQTAPLREGVYYFQETKAPAGYELDETIYQFYVGDDVESIQYGGTSDLIKSNIQILVVDELGSAVSGVEYKLIDSNGDEQSFKSDENGNLKIDDLTAGTYSLVLKDKSYTSDNEEYTFKIL